MISNIKTKTWNEIHALLSVFFLPVALLYVITGGLYIMGAGGKEHGSRSPSFAGRPLPSGVSSATADPAEPGDNGSDIMNGPKRNYKNNVGIHRNQLSDEMLRMPKRPSGLYDKVMLLHKAKGGLAFNILGGTFALSMIFIYFSGIVLYWAAPGKRRRMLITAALGLVVTGAVVLPALLN